MAFHVSHVYIVDDQQSIWIRPDDGGYTINLQWMDDDGNYCETVLARTTSLEQARKVSMQQAKRLQQEDV